MDIEHIISAKFIGDFAKGNGIGNLMYLEKNINRAVGGMTQKNESLTTDLSDNKLRSDDILNYHKSNIASVIVFLRDLPSKSNTEQDYISLIAERHSRKHSMIMNLFGELLDQE